MKKQQRKLPAVLLGLLMALAGQATQLRAATLTVDDDGIADFASIQEAIDAAAPGDTINVAAGTYHEMISFSTTDLTITGAGRNSTFILKPNNGLGTSTVIMHASRNSISGFTIQGQGYEQFGVMWIAGADNIISNCHFLAPPQRTANRGVNMAGTRHQFHDNIVEAYDGFWGLVLQNVVDTQILNNEFIDNLVCISMSGNNNRNSLISGNVLRGDFNSGISCGGGDYTGHGH